MDIFADRVRQKKIEIEGVKNEIEGQLQHIIHTASTQVAMRMFDVLMCIKEPRTEGDHLLVEHARKYTMCMMMLKYLEIQEFEDGN